MLYYAASVHVFCGGDHSTEQGILNTMFSFTRIVRYRKYFKDVLFFINKLHVFLNVEIYTQIFSIKATTRVSTLLLESEVNIISYSLEYAYYRVSRRSFCIRIC